MSAMRAAQTFFHGGGQEEAGTVRPADDPLVLAFTAFYEPVDQVEEEPRRGRGRPPGSKNKPKDGTDEG